jgi:hypothetical protein
VWSDFYRKNSGKHRKDNGAGPGKTLYTPLKYNDPVTKLRACVDVWGPLNHCAAWDGPGDGR